jgi:hypothetical protein
VVPLGIAVLREPTSAQLQIARFLRDVVRASAAWCIVHRDEPIVIHAPREDILPLWSCPEVARGSQRRGWPQLAVGELSLCELITHYLPTSHEMGISIGLRVSADDEHVVTIPADWLERALRAGIETGWRDPAELD